MHGSRHHPRAFPKVHLHRRHSYSALYTAVYASAHTFQVGKNIVLSATVQSSSSELVQKLSSVHSVHVYDARVSGTAHCIMKAALSLWASGELIVVAVQFIVTIPPQQYARRIHPFLEERRIHLQQSAVLRSKYNATHDSLRCSKKVRSSQQQLTCVPLALTMICTFLTSWLLLSHNERLPSGWQQERRDFDPGEIMIHRCLNSWNCH